jgi:hypothetical protein
VSRNFLRKCILTLQGSSTYSIPGGAPGDLFIEFNIGQSTIQTPHPARFRIHNPSRALVSEFKCKEFTQLNFNAGYENNCGFIYTGEILQTIYGWDDNPVNKWVDIFCGCFSNAYQQARVGSTLAAGWTPRDKVNLALQSMQPLGIKGLGFNNIDLDTPKYPRGRPFIGQARDLLRQVSLSKGAVWWMGTDGRVHIVDHTKSLPSDKQVVEVNSSTGQVGFAQQSDHGILVRVLINPAIGVATAIKLDESSIIEGERNNSVQPSDERTANQTRFNITGLISADGIYRVAFMDVYGGTRSQAWYMDLTCIGTGGVLTDGQVSSYDGPPLDTGPL